MALINCNECGKEVSDKAITCPNCGAPIKKDNVYVKRPVGQITPQPKKKTNKGLIICIVIAVILIIGLFGGSNESESDKNDSNNKEIGKIQEENSNLEVEELEKEDSIELAKVGEYVEGDTWKISLLDAKEYDSIGDEFYQSTPEIDGNKYLVLFFEVENVSKEDDYFNMFYMESYLDGYAIDQSLIMGNVENYESLGGDIASGKKMKGYVVYEVNPEWKELEFSYKNWVANSTKVATFVVTPEQL